MIDFNSTLNDRLGEPLKTANGEALTVKMAILGALDAQTPDDSSISVYERLCHDRLARGVFTYDQMALGLEEKLYILTRAGKLYPPIVLGRLQEALFEK